MRILACGLMAGSLAARSLGASFDQGKLLEQGDVLPLRERYRVVAWHCSHDQGARPMGETLREDEARTGQVMTPTDHDDPLPVPFDRKRAGVQCFPSSGRRNRAAAYDRNVSAGTCAGAPHDRIVSWIRVRQHQCVPAET